MKSVSPEDLNTVRRILRKHLAKIGAEVLLFGSRVSGGFTKSSDLDLLLRAKNPVPMDVMTELREAFEESDLPFEVDLIDDHGLDPKFRDKILPGAVKLDLQG